MLTQRERSVVLGWIAIEIILGIILAVVAAHAEPAPCELIYPVWTESQKCVVVVPPPPVNAPQK